MPGDPGRDSQRPAVPYLRVPIDQGHNAAERDGNNQFDAASMRAGVNFDGQRSENRLVSSRSRAVVKV